LKNGSKLLDLGCGIGQNIRKLILDGALARNISGGDLSTELIECGYEYFRDRDTLISKFYTFDILDPSPGDSFRKLEGFFDAICANMFFHLWDLPTQIQACIRTISLLKPHPGSVLIGCQIGGPGGDII
jgi:SAM-dependent methyltransferase